MLDDVDVRGSPAQLLLLYGEVMMTVCSVLTRE